MACIVAPLTRLDEEEAVLARKEAEEEAEEEQRTDDETTPTTAVSDCSEPPLEDTWESELLEECDGARQLGPGLFEEDQGCGEPAEPYTPPAATESAVEEQHLRSSDPGGEAEGEGAGFTMEETLFIFDWDDTILPSSWIQRQGLRLDSNSTVSHAQRESLAEASAAASETLRLAKQAGTVVLVTNAERGWIELSCLKFLPSLLPIIENVRIVSARTNFERAVHWSPLEWKVLAFEAEIARSCGALALVDPSKRKNIHSLGDSVHEREALQRATFGLPNCCSKALKFVDRPDIGQLLSQHALITRSFEQIVQHDGDLDLSINC
mmetsp:Transcript_67965/g.196898  ORF Transcript_67965/g.196898 Transcript_67965/m.196898 type:complete len:323 (-) Transcript_67965:364-1332(-)